MIEERNDPAESVCSYIGDLIVGQLEDVLHDVIHFTDQLHIAVLNAVVNHFHEMTGTGWADLHRSAEEEKECQCRTQSQHGCPSALAAIF